MAVLSQLYLIKIINIKIQTTQYIVIILFNVSYNYFTDR